MNPEPTVLSFPIMGVSVAKRPPRHHPMALDLMGLTELAGRTSEASAVRWLLGRVDATSYHGWGRPVQAPGRGKVVATSDHTQDRSTTGALSTVALWVYASFIFRPPQGEDGVPDISGNVGNHVMVDLDAGGVAFYAHLQAESISVKVGDRVDANVVVGAVGNSGNTTAPHLHIHVLDQMVDLRTAELRPFVFAAYERWDGAKWVSQLNAIPDAGDVVRALEA